MVSKRKAEKHLAKIADQCMPGEKIIDSITGFSIKWWATGRSTKGVLAITGSRVLFSGSRMFWTEFKSTPFGQVASVELRSAFARSTFRVSTGSEVSTYRVDHAHAEAFAASVRQMISATRVPQSQMASE